MGRFLRLGAPPPVTRLQVCKNNYLSVTKGVTDENRSGYTSILVTDVTCNRRNSRRLHARLHLSY